MIIGRCADYILKDDPDAYHIFVCGNEAEKIARTQKLFDLSEKEARNMNQDMDKKRRLHYEYYTDRKWGDFKNHCMILNTSILGLERCIQYIVELIEQLNNHLHNSRGQRLPTVTAGGRCLLILLISGLNH